jgi:hypothetical protein
MPQTLYEIDLKFRENRSSKTSQKTKINNKIRRGI